MLPYCNHLISVEKKFFFCHIPKCAGTSIVSSLPTGKKSKGKPGHITCNEMKKLFETSNLVWNDFFKFTFVRNPWALEVSHYFYGKKIESMYKRGLMKPRKDQHVGKLCTNLTFDEYIKHQINNSPEPSGVVLSAWIDDPAGVCMVDSINKVEHINSNYMDICSLIGVPVNNIKWKNKTTHSDYKSYYNTETADYIRKKYEYDIDRFKYTFN